MAMAMENLQITDMSDNSAPAEGGKKLIILCERIPKPKGNIKVRFFDNSGWEEWVELGVSGIHKQYAISLTVPRYISIFLLLTDSKSYHCIDIFEIDLK